MPSSSDIDTPSHTLQYSICFIVILVVIFTNLSLPTINPHCRLIHQQWGSCYIQEGNNKVETTMPISWGKWGLMCFTGLMTQGLFTPIKWDDQAVNKNSGKAIFRTENNVSLTTWVSYLYIGF